MKNFDLIISHEHFTCASLHVCCNFLLNSIGRHLPSRRNIRGKLARWNSQQKHLIKFLERSAFRFRNVEPGDENRNQAEARKHKANKTLKIRITGVEQVRSEESKEPCKESINNKCKSLRQGP